MASNLSERILDMVETDRRFIGLSADSVLMWIKLMRLHGRGELPGSTDEDLSNAMSGEVALHFLGNPHAGYGYLSSLADRPLPVKVDGRYCAPPELVAAHSGPLITRLPRLVRDGES